MEPKYKLEGTRKILVLIGVFAFAAVMAFLGMMDERMSEVIIYVAGLFFGANGLEHIGRGIASGKKLGEAAGELKTELES